MLTNNDLLLRQKIMGHEGKNPYAYQDSLGYWSVGWGRCIDKRITDAGLTGEEMLYLFNNDIARAKQELLQYTWYQLLDEVRRGVLVELVFNMGLPHLLTFVKMIENLKTLDYEGAAKELLDSEWTRQVGPNRSQDLANRLINGKY